MPSSKLLTIISIEHFNSKNIMYNKIYNIARMWCNVTFTCEYLLLQYNNTEQPESNVLYN